MRGEFELQCALPADVVNVFHKIMSYLSTTSNKRINGNKFGRNQFATSIRRKARFDKMVFCLLLTLSVFLVILMPCRMNVLGDEFCGNVIFIIFQSNLFSIEKLPAKISALSQRFAERIISHVLR